MALEGTLNYLDIAHLLQVVGQSRKSGELNIAWEDRQSRLFFERGALIRAESNRIHDGIGTLLVHAGLLSHEDLDLALAKQRSDSERRRLGAILCDDFGIQHRDIERLLRRQFEQIVFDVFSWPGGRFVFQFEGASEPPERFRLDAIEFILEVGIQAGFLAEEGAERERDDPDRPHLVFLEGDGEILAVYEDHWRRKGYRVSGFQDPKDALGCLCGWDGDLRAPVVVAHMGRLTESEPQSTCGLDLLRAFDSAPSHPKVIALGENWNPNACLAARAAGAAVLVRKPPAEELRGADGRARLDVFMIAIERALERTLFGPESASSEADE